jgi:hypothetical protein
MIEFRRRIRAIAWAWLLCQAASLAAFVPEECCSSHAAQAAAKANEAECHENAPAEPKEGDACPMHRMSPTTAPQQQGQPHTCCAISNTCDGPGQQLTTLFAYVGVVQSPQSTPLSLESIALFIAPTDPLPDHLAVPDSPPPRS